MKGEETHDQLLPSYRENSYTWLSDYAYWITYLKRLLLVPRLNNIFLLIAL